MYMYSSGRQAYTANQLRTADGRKGGGVLICLQLMRATQGSAPCLEGRYVCVRNFAPVDMLTPGRVLQQDN